MPVGERSIDELTRRKVHDTYHQDYVRRHPDDGYVRAVALPKVKKVRTLYPDRLKSSGHDGDR